MTAVLGAAVLGAANLVAGLDDRGVRLVLPVDRDRQVVLGLEQLDLRLVGQLLDQVGGHLLHAAGDREHVQHQQQVLGHGGITESKGP